MKKAIRRAEHLTRLGFAQASIQTHPRLDFFLDPANDAPSMRSIAWLVLFLLCPSWAADKPKIVFISGEYEYHSRETLPAFASDLEKKFAVETVFLQRPEDPKLERIPGLEALESADLAIFFIRRMTLPEDELKRIRKYVDSGKPIIGLRTASHAFQNWKEFDRDVLGGNYGNHYGNKLKTAISIIPEAKDHPILRNFSPFVSEGSLYRNTPLPPGSQPLLLGTVEGKPPEPIAWTHQYKTARVFYTSLGHPSDFQEESFKTLVRNGIEWALQKPLKPIQSK
jgi:type 1 glutamine amidotransferase